MAEKIIVGMSGGVDSSVAALLLKDQGYDVLGVFMRNWEEDDADGLCTATQDYEDVRAACDVIGIPYYTVNFSRQYWDKVFALFLEEYRHGRTPNPDILCNREIKFGDFMNFAIGMGVERVATGHFARTDGIHLYKGIDGEKDQSYFLHLLSREQLSRAVFPLGDMTKAQVRQIARQAGLPTAEKKDSTGVCFIGERDFKAFLMQYLPAKKGRMMTADGKTVGEHDGVLYYTIGQRKGLGIGGNGVNAPWYVIDKDVVNNILYVSQGDSSELYSNELTAINMHWISDNPPIQDKALSAKIRYRQPDQVCSVKDSGDSITVWFDKPQRAVTPGQSVVFYDGDTCLGGAVIQSCKRQI